MNIHPIAYIHTDFKDKFGIPRQSGLVPELVGVIEMEPAYRNPDGFRGIDEYSHIWVLWGFNRSMRENESLSVHPPRLGGKVKRGVFATRSPFRPNGIGLSCLKLEKMIADEAGLRLIVSGVDMLDGTPIFDIKPYMAYSDSIPEAEGGTGHGRICGEIEVEFPEELQIILPEDKRQAALHILEQDPRAAYHKEPGYVYGMEFAGYDIRFTADDSLIRVQDVVKRDDSLTNIK